MADMHAEPSENHDDLPPAGERSGRGAGSVLPYLSKSLQSRPAANVDAKDVANAARHPVLADWPPGKRS